MTSIPYTLSILPLQSISPQDRIRNVRVWPFTNLHMLWSDSCRLRRVCRRSSWVLWVRASGDSLDSNGTERGGNGDRTEVGSNGVDSVKANSAPLQGLINALPPAIFVMKINIGSKLAVGLCIAFALLAIAVRKIMLKQHNHNHRGSVADLVRRGQLRSDRRSISKPLKYEDPFNNPLVKVCKNNSSIEMCGKVYQLAPVTLTEEQQSIHQKRRSRAYQWKRPTVFLKEGDSIPPDVDPDTVSWIPTNHPFATTVNDMDEDLAQNNVYQKHGVPFRVRAEHEAMQKRLEALQNEQKLNRVEIDPSLIRDFERPFRPSSKPLDPTELSFSDDQKYSNGTSKSNEEVDSSGDQTLKDELKKP